MTSFLLITLLGQLVFASSDRVSLTEDCYVSRPASACVENLSLGECQDFRSPATSVFIGENGTSFRHISVLKLFPRCYNTLAPLLCDAMYPVCEVREVFSLDGTNETAVIQKISDADCENTIEACSSVFDVRPDLKLLLKPCTEPNEFRTSQNCVKVVDATDPALALLSGTPIELYYPHAKMSCLAPLHYSDSSSSGLIHVIDACYLKCLPYQSYAGVHTTLVFILGIMYTCVSFSYMVLTSYCMTTAQNAHFWLFSLLFGDFYALTWMIFSLHFASGLINCNNTMYTQNFVNHANIWLAVLQTFCAQIMMSSAVLLLIFHASNVASTRWPAFISKNFQNRKLFYSTMLMLCCAFCSVFLVWQFGHEPDWITGILLPGNSSINSLLVHLVSILLVNFMLFGVLSFIDFVKKYDDTDGIFRWSFFEFISVESLLRYINQSTSSISSFTGRSWKLKHCFLAWLGISILSACFHVWLIDNWKISIIKNAKFTLNTIFTLSPSTQEDLASIAFNSADKTILSLPSPIFRLYFRFVLFLVLPLGVHACAMLFEMHRILFRSSNQSYTVRRESTYDVEWVSMDPAEDLDALDGHCFEI